MDKTQLLPPRIRELQKEAEADLSLNEMNIRDKALKCPALKAKWLQILFAEEATLKAIEELKDQKEEEYISKHGQPGVPKFKAKVEAEQSVAIVELGKKIEKQKEVIRYCEGLLKFFSTFGFDIKNSIDILKLES